MKRITAAFCLTIVILFVSCTKENTENRPFGDFISATVNGVNYNSTDIVVVTEPSTGELSFFYSNSADSVSIGLSVNPTLPSYAEGTYNFRPASPQGVRLLIFDIECNNFRPEINWVTAEETNLDYVIVESSLDAVTFSQVGIVDALGNTTTSTSYQYNDNANWFRDKTYYRLKFINVDGSFVYSQVRLYSSCSFNAFYKDVAGKYKGYDGTITISNHNRQTKVVTGSFSFDVKDYSNNSKRIRNGSFSVSYYYY